jgi:hypothetical protein
MRFSAFLRGLMGKDDLDVPVLLLAWRRPEHTRQVFDAIRRAAPSRLYVACDGPRSDHPEDAVLIRQVQSIVMNVDWDCKVFTLFQDKNLGCGRGPGSAIDWFFQHEEAGIIFEDDCVPDQTFFQFCQELLEKYRDDERIMHISGDNGVGRHGDGRGSILTLT